VSPTPVREIDEPAGRLICGLMLHDCQDLRVLDQVVPRGHFVLVVRRLHGKDARVGWGLEAALGMAVHLALGGILAMCSWVSVGTICGAVWRPIVAASRSSIRPFQASH